MTAAHDPASPLLLAIESASRVAGVALLRGADVLGALTSDAGQHHSESLLPMAASLLAEAAAEPRDIDAFAVGVGPGAFTSIRIGVATVKGLAFGTDRPVAPVSALAAIAHQSFAAHADSSRVVAVLDARRGFVFAGEFERGAQGGGPLLVGTEARRAVAELLDEAATGAQLAGELPPRLAEAIAEAGRDDLELLAGSDSPRAVAVGQLGRAALIAGQTTLASQLVPQYLQRPEAEETRLAAQDRPAGDPPR